VCVCVCVCDVCVWGGGGMCVWDVCMCFMCEWWDERTVEEVCVCVRERECV